MVLLYRCLTNSQETLRTVVYLAEVILMDKKVMTKDNHYQRQIVEDRKTKEDAKTTKRR